MAVVDLPAPSPDALAHSEKLHDHIVQTIECHGGLISFEQFMSACLYTPALGYYAAGAEKFGEAGDFVTAPDISPLFGVCVANQVDEVFARIGGGDILEVGGGRGTLAPQILQSLAAHDHLPAHYFILETSPDLRDRQRQQLESIDPPGAESVRWLDALPDDGFRGVVIANELLDAFATQRVRIDGQQVTEICVANGYPGFKFAERPADEALRAQVQELVQRLPQALPRGYVTEVNRLRVPWVKQTLACLDEGLLLLLDYGYPAREYYHPERTAGTLSCFYRHRTHANPLILVGLQDITSHVDFSQIAAASRGTGAGLGGFTTQANFLLSCGLLSALEGQQPGSRQYLEAASQLKTLTLPGQMGELVKVMGFTQSMPGPLLGFTHRDLSAWL